MSKVEQLAEFREPAGPPDPNSAVAQLIWMAQHIHEFADIDGRGQFMFWNTAQQALAEMGFNKQDLATAMHKRQETANA